MMAANTGNVGALKVLLAHGADVNATESVNGENLPLHRILSERGLASVPYHIAAKI